MAELFDWTFKIITLVLACYGIMAAVGAKRSALAAEKQAVAAKRQADVAEQQIAILEQQAEEAKKSALIAARRRILDGIDQIASAQTASVRGTNGMAIAVAAKSLLLLANQIEDFPPSTTKVASELFDRSMKDLRTLAVALRQNGAEQAHFAQAVATLGDLSNYLRRATHWTDANDAHTEN